MKSNPFNISFGKEPAQLLSRQNNVNEIEEVFNSDNPETESFIITGPRGSGKTVLLTEIKHQFDQYENWIAIDINPCMDMHEQIAARLYESGKINKLFLKNEFSFSFNGISFCLSGDEKVNDIYTLLTKMFIYLKKKNIKVLITIDDISKNEFVKAFAHTFQSFLREKYLVYFIATGIYNNVCSVSNDKALTFLLRTPKIVLGSLNLRAIASSYSNIFEIDIEKAIKLAKLTSGYAYGYQLLGNLLYKQGSIEITDSLVNDFDLILEDRVYAQIWKELTKIEKNILINLASNEDMSNSDIAMKLNIKSNAFEVYKKSLIFSGIVENYERGHIRFALPRFKEFVSFRAIIE